MRKALRSRAWSAGAVLFSIAAFAAVAEPLGPTPEVGAGPNHRPGAPFRNKLSPPGAEGTVVIIIGVVRDAKTGEGIAGAVLDAYQADANGEYDNDGFDYRARIRTDELGHYELETIQPRSYGPPPHIHLIVTAEGHTTLRTEIRFRDERYPTNERPELTPTLVESTSGGRPHLRGTFDIVLRASS